VTCWIESLHQLHWHLFRTLSAVYAKVRLLWTALWIVGVFLALAATFAGGCTRTILVPEASPIRIGPMVKGRIYILDDGKWRLSDESIVLNEGWYVVPPSFVEEEQ